MPTALLFGASGQVGAAVLQRLRAQGWQVLAVSRHRQSPQPGVEWLQGGFADLPPLPPRVDAVVSCGPLDLFGEWIGSTAVRFGRVVAFGSTSLLVKRDSVDPAERAISAKLQGGEAAVLAAGIRRGVAATVLRPTLIYGAGRDATLTRIAMLATRMRCFVLPRDARGLRQPVHVDDLALAALACLNRDAAAGKAYALPGGETLAYDDMVRRVLQALPTRPRLLRLPPTVFRVVVALARRTGRFGGFGDGALARLREDLVFDVGPAQRDLGYRPRRFAPTLAMLTPPASC
ncbi:MAG: nucleoside-diphosphate sugar epimerase [Pseudoxanthomonas suwonensis]|nr:nucleoside-diphosphate sugar epimerase [Pseudoxanthomonas suwonensis]